MVVDGNGEKGHIKITSASIHEAWSFCSPYLAKLFSTPKLIFICEKHFWNIYSRFNSQTRSISKSFLRLNTWFGIFESYPSLSSPCNFEQRIIFSFMREYNSRFPCAHNGVGSPERVGRQKWRAELSTIRVRRELSSPQTKLRCHVDYTNTVYTI